MKVIRWEVTICEDWVWTWGSLRPFKAGIQHYHWSILSEGLLLHSFPYSWLSLLLFKAQCSDNEYFYQNNSINFGWHWLELAINYQRARKRITVFANLIFIQYSYWMTQFIQTSKISWSCWPIHVFVWSYNVPRIKMKERYLLRDCVEITISYAKVNIPKWNI